MKSKTNKSIFFNLMKSSVVIIIVCTLLMSSINILLSNSFSKNKLANELKDISDQVNTLTSQFTQKYNQEANYLYQLSLDQIAKYSDSTIVIVNTNGTVFANSSTPYKLPQKIDVDQYKSVFEGKSTYSIGRFNSTFKYNTFSIATPFSYNNKIEGIIFVITKNTFLTPETFSAMTMNLVSLAIAIIIAIIVSYFLSRRLIKPLKKIGNGAKEIAYGKYNTIETNTKIIEYNELISSFNQMSAELKKQDEARSEFIANVSHDLKTPLTTIIGFVGGIMDGTIPKDSQNQYLGVALSEAERMTKMINNNLDLSKYESDYVNLTMTTINLNEIVRSIAITLERRIREKGIVIQFKYEKTENFVEADESAIYRVIQNLFDNALKFAEKDSEIEISIIPHGDLTHFRIKNYGSTIGEEEQKYIWDRYYKADKSRGTDKRGSGLGLFIVKSIIKQHNQQIFIESDENSTAFEFTLKTSDC